MLLEYFLPRLANVSKIRITKNVRDPLVAPTVPKGFRLSQKIIPYIKKLTFVDYDIWKFPELDMKNYMLVVQAPSSNGIGKRTGPSRFIVTNVYVAFQPKHRGECMC